jgi:hypothetical protein
LLTTSTRINIHEFVSNLTSQTPTATTRHVNTSQINATGTPTHILRVRIRVHNSLIETLVNQKQLDLIEVQLRQRQIPFRQIQDNKDGITIIIGPFHKSTNLTATMMMFNQSRFHTNLTRIVPIKSSIVDMKNSNNATINSNEKKTRVEHYPLSVEAHEYDLAHDQGNVLFDRLSTFDLV